MLFVMYNVYITFTLVMPKESAKARTNLFIEVDLVKKLDYIANMEFAINSRKATRTDIVNEALTDYVAKYEKKNGPIPVK